MPQTTLKSSVNDNCQGLDRKRRSHPCRQIKSNSYGGVSLASNSHDGNESYVSDVPPRLIVEDGVSFFIFYFFCKLMVTPNPYQVLAFLFIVVFMLVDVSLKGSVPLSL